MLVIIMVNYLDMQDIEYKDESLITKSQWKDILQNDKIARDLDIKTLLVAFNSPLHRTTATEIAETLGEKDYHIISGGNISFSRRICKELNIKPPKNSDGGNRWWTIPYWGSPTGDGKYYYILICPNCHSMLHRSNLTIEQLREILKKR